MESVKSWVYELLKKEEFRRGISLYVRLIKYAWKEGLPPLLPSRSKSRQLFVDGRRKQFSSLFLPQQNRPKMVALGPLPRTVKNWSKGLLAHPLDWARLAFVQNFYCSQLLVSILFWGNFKLFLPVQLLFDLDTKGYVGTVCIM